MAESYLDLKLTPNRSLERRHSYWLIGGVGLIFLLFGMRLLVLGAWPVLPFMLADLALLAFAFRASYRSGRAYERLRLDDDVLVIAKVSPQGHERRFTLEPYWARVQIEPISDEENRLWLASRGRRVLLGAFLSPAERRELRNIIADGLTRFRARR